MSSDEKPFWSIPTPELIEQLQTTPEGLTNDEVQRRLSSYGYNLLKEKKKADAITLLLNQFRSPLVLILLVAAILSIFLQDPTSAAIILAIVFISGILGFSQERGASDAVKKLLSIVQVNTTALRNGQTSQIPLEQIVPGDIVILNAGNMVPGDCALVEARDLFVDEATLTGETYPAEKSISTLKPDTPLSARSNTLFMGTHVVSGTGKALVVTTGKKTEFGKISESLTLKPPETGFEHGVRQFGYLLMEITLIMTITIFAVNAYFGMELLAVLELALELVVHSE